MAVARVVGLNVSRKDNVLLLGRHLEGVVGVPPADHAGQDLNEAGVGPHGVAVDQACAMLPYLHPHCMQCRVPSNSTGTTSGHVAMT